MNPQLKQLIELLIPAILEVIEKESNTINANNSLDLLNIPSIHIPGDEL